MVHHFDRGPTRTRRVATWVLGALGLLAFLSADGRQACGQMEYEGEPIRYHDRAVQDPVARLQARLDAGDVQLAFDPRHGYLPALLQALQIPASSQMLVFSKTSLQINRITPQRPRALYFNDDTYIGWVQSGDVVEISTVDPDQGAIFYTLDQQAVDRPQLVRDKGQCLSCHASSRTQGVPGHLVRSVYPATDGQPHFGSGTFLSDHSSPFQERWGGWYVTGRHGAMRHMGNVCSPSREEAEKLDREAGANRESLEGLLSVSPYLQPTSDLVALMVLEHQTQMHNWLTLANYTARRVAHQDRVINEALQREPGYVSDSSRRQIASVGDKVLKYLLFSGEFALTSPVEGTSAFAREFAAEGPRDQQGRSLRDLDLQTRMFRYPCSYLVYAPSFERLPDSIRSYIVDRLLRVLRGEDADPAFQHLRPEDRASILAILEDTRPEWFAAR